MKKLLLICVLVAAALNVVSCNNKTIIEEEPIEAEAAKEEIEAAKDEAEKELKNITKKYKEGTIDIIEYNYLIDEIKKPAKEEIKKEPAKEEIKEPAKEEIKEPIEEEPIEEEPILGDKLKEIVKKAVDYSFRNDFIEPSFLEGKNIEFMLSTYKEGKPKIQSIQNTELVNTEFIIEVVNNDFKGLINENLNFYIYIYYDNKDNYMNNIEVSIVKE